MSNSCYSFLKCLKEFASENIWIWIFQWKTFIKKINFFLNVDLGLFTLLNSSSVSFDKLNFSKILSITFKFVGVKFFVISSFVITSMPLGFIVIYSSLSNLTPDVSYLYLLFFMRLILRGNYQFY